MKRTKPDIKQLSVQCRHLSQSVTEWSDEFLERVVNLVGSMENVEEFSHCITELQNDVPRYKTQAILLLQYLKKHSPISIHEHLKSER